MHKKEESTRKMMTRCDIVLMIPGRRDVDEKDGKNHTLPVRDFGVSRTILDAIRKNVEIEMSADAQETIERYDLGSVDLIFEHDPDMPRQDDILWEKKNACCMLAVHKSTKLCVLEIYIPESDDGVQMLECYGNDAVLIRTEGRDDHIPLEELLQELEIRVTGLKRSAVFAFGEPSDMECVHCIANELTPHDGDVEGVLMEKVRSQNRSQYSGSRTYASATTLLEVSADPEMPPMEERINYQTSEIYFVEQILLRDASATDIARRLADLSSRFRNMKAREIKAELTRIDAALGQSTVLYDVSLFKWATVHEEISLLSEDLGVPVILERNRNSKAILESLQRAVEAQEKERSDDLKNGFLLAITGMTLIDTLFNAITNFSSKNTIYYASLGIVIAAFAVYMVIKKKKF